MMEEKKITEFDLQMAILCHHSPFSGKLLIPNMSTGWGEADVLMLSKAGYATEYEVKISRSDFAADKKKVLKHETYLKIFNRSPFEWWDGRPREKRGIPNYFVYVVPGYFNVRTLNIPEYAGLWIVKDGHVESIKAPPVIHKEKFKEYWTARIAHSFNAKYFYHYFRKKDSVREVIAC